MCKPNYGGIVLLPLLLASCIGGNFGVQPVVESTPTAYPVTFKSKDVPTSPPAGPSVETTPVNRPAVGAAMRLLRRNIAFHREDGTEIPNSKQAEEELSFKEEDILFLYGSKKDKLQQLKDKIHQRNPNVEIRTSENENKKYGYEFVDAGYVYTTKGKDEIEWTSNHKQFTYRFGYDGFVYYSGEHPSQSLPSAGTVKYSGNWQYMTDAIRHRTGKAGDPSEDLGYIVYYGQNVGATSYAATADDREGKHPAEYTVDFGKKTLTGKLIKNQYVQKKTDEKKPLTIYDITATLDGNRFTGSASVNPDLATNHANKEHLFFHTNADQRLEGGFFGDNGEELAGRFISNDNSVFGVFAGKKTETANAADTKPALPSGKHTKILDSLKISVDEATDGHARKFAISSMPDFGHPDKLLVEGREIPLVNKEQIIKLADGRKMTVSACCDFLTYVKLGRIKTERPAVKPKAQDEEGDEEDAGVDNDEESEDEAVEDEGGEEDETSEEDNGEDEEATAEEETEEVDEAEEEEVEEPEEKSPAEEGNGGSGSILPAPEAPKGRDIDLFLKGIRTAEADIPKNGTAHYTGTWEARIGVPDKKGEQLDGTTSIQKDSYANQAAKAEFDVDFGAKSLSGKLTEKNDTNPAFYIEKGVIDGNGFHALARTRENGVDLSGQGSTNPQSFKASNLLVEGGFYGPQAAELGGNIIDSDRKFGAVFGAKKDDKEATR